MYYKKYERKPLDGDWKFRDYNFLTRKNWNYQFMGCTSSEIDSKKWLKKICNKKNRHQFLADGGYYKKLNEYDWILS